MHLKVVKKNGSMTNILNVSTITTSGGVNFFLTGENLVLQTYVLVWEPVIKQKRLLVLSQKRCFKFRNLFLFNEYTFIYHINLEELKKINLVAFFVCF